jgi:hypothetical protein
MGSEHGIEKVKYLDLNEGVRISRSIADLNERCKAIRDGQAGAVSAVERCNGGGRELCKRLCNCVRASRR